MSNPKNKIKSVAELGPIIKKLKAAKKKVVLSHGVFDLLHYGHVDYLQQARNLGDVLLVSMVTDKFVKKGPGRPVFKEDIRANSLAALTAVDYVIPCNDYGPWKIMEILEPHVYAKGDDSKEQLKNPDSGLNKDKKIMESFGGSLQFTKSLPIHSTELLKSHYSIFSPDVSSFLNSFKKTYPVSYVITKLEELKKMKVLVIGEAIIDEYRYVTPLGKPSKSHILATQYLSNEEFVGGSLACANHVASVCDQVDLVTYLGEIDSREKFIRQHLNANVTPKFFYCPGQPTIIKKRFIDSAYFHKFFEEYIFDKNFLPAKVEKKLWDYLRKNIDNYDLVIAVDYGHGFLSKKLIDLISRKAKFLAVNTQTNSGNTGFNYIVKYPKVDYACIDELEARLAVQDNLSDIKVVLNSLLEKFTVKKMVVTLGHRGSLAYENGNSRFKSIPSFATKITDTVGAGDAFLAISSPCAAAGLPMELVSFIGNVAGSIAVGILGNKSSVEREELFRHVSYLLE